MPSPTFSSRIVVPPLSLETNSVRVDKLSRRLAEKTLEDSGMLEGEAAPHLEEVEEEHRGLEEQEADWEVASVIEKLMSPNVER